MRPAIIKSKKAQIEVFERLHARMKKQFTGHEPDNKYFLRGYKGAEDLAGFGLDFWIEFKWMGVNLWGPPLDGSHGNRNVLGFATYSARSGIGRTAAILARDPEGIALYHDGRVYARDGRARPHRDEPMIQINGRLYYRIAYVDDDHFFDRILEYHFSRLNVDLGAGGGRGGTKGRGTGMDAGPAAGGERSSAVFIAQHNPLTIALWKQLEALGYKKCPCDVVTPDLLVKKNARSVLFEVKPSALSHDLMLACGQVLVYNEHAKADRTVIVSAKAGVSGYGEGLARVMKKNGIAFVPYRKTNDGYIFEGLERILPV
ncbi:hypothetical protein GA0061099_100367 [Bradyrhizobium yuanmingense]|uniref:Uncharacterized protein n=1 Tax=Bradyrhizobium yuanmingense TaxID=108015 RepID=A0A1C3V2J5_9BRAD|nr:hypothetical protein [Bradyrhizobium yuanmingense]TWI26584.1 hypothetical protein IQ15_04019 [Bradyrhizobium yuanmingense]SCB21905.1 hypothetical protein GA0061099_100367 [Bradyrhizobium yuanmingense]